MRVKCQKKRKYSGRTKILNPPPLKKNTSHIERRIVVSNLKIYNAVIYLYI